MNLYHEEPVLKSAQVSDVTEFKSLLNYVAELGRTFKEAVSKAKTEFRTLSTLDNDIVNMPLQQAISVLR